MKFIISIALLFLTNIMSITAPSLNTVRTWYQNSSTDKKSCEKLVETLKPFNEKNNPLLLGYRASAIMTMAQHVSNPFTRLSYFNEGKPLLEKAIAAAPDNVELRLLRYNIQANAPSFLNYNKALKADKAFIQQRLPHIKDMELKKFILVFFKGN